MFHVFVVFFCSFATFALISAFIFFIETCIRDFEAGFSFLILLFFLSLSVVVKQFNMESIPDIAPTTLSAHLSL
jgi:hypothetical protein